MTDAVRGRLVALLLDLLSVPSPTGEEGPLADRLQAALRREGHPVRRVGNSLVAGDVGDERPTVLLVGHLDVVPPTERDREAKVVGDRVVGRGASDMKSGLAVAIEAFASGVWRRGPYQVALVAYAGEEGGHAGNELGGLLEEAPELTAASLAIVLEPTDLTVQLGCLGALQVEVTVRGRAAHAARPWQGENALTKGAPLLVALHGRAPEPVVVDGLRYRQVVTPTAAWTGEREQVGRSRNVVPDSFTVNLNYRFAPDKGVAEATSRLRSLVYQLGAPGSEITVIDEAPAAPPHRGDPLVAAFIAAAGSASEPVAVEAKQAWTDVARFAEVGVPALNYGPGLVAQAHQSGEYVPTANLTQAAAALRRFLVPEDAGRAPASGPMRRPSRGGPA